MAVGAPVLGIEVAPELVEQWVGWLAPDRQPFLVDPQDPLAEAVGTQCPLELVDTFELYALGRRKLSLAWLTEQEFMAMPRSQRADLVRSQVRLGRAAVPTVAAWLEVTGEAVRAQADGWRFVWWPSLLSGHEPAVLAAFVTNDRLQSRHKQVRAGTWRAATQLLPNAFQLAGTFPASSGPNCFGTVMALAGVPGAETEQMQREPFEAWLAERTRPGGTDHELGTVFVWRAPNGDADHAGVTLGDGWAMHKPSQGWMSPIKVLSVGDLKRRGRTRGLRLHRYAIQPT